MPSKGADRRFSFTNGAAKAGPPQAAWPSAGIICAGFLREFVMKHALLSHNRWTFPHIPVQTDKEFER